MKKVLSLVLALVLVLCSVSALAEDAVKLGQVDFAAHGTKCFAVITVAMQGDKIAAAYIRVSTDSADQENSYEAQERYFSSLLLHHPGWIGAGIYADYGLSGTSGERRTGYSRIPVYHGSVDRIVGIAHIKDIISPILDDGEGATAISGHMRTPDYVPDTKDIIPLLSEMQTSHDQMVIVVDEYGGTAGVITIEDIVEEVVGEIEDEFDPDNKYITQLSDREWLVDGRFPLDDAIDLGWPIEDNEEYETVAGFVIERADKLPRPGDVVEKDGYRFLVQSMRGRRIAMLRVTAPEPPTDPDQTAPGQAPSAGGEKDVEPASN